MSDHGAQDGVAAGAASILDTNHFSKEKKKIDAQIKVVFLDEDNDEDEDSNENQDIDKDKESEDSSEDSSEEDENEEGELDDEAKVLARLRPLTAEEDALVTETLKPPWDEQVLVERFGTTMTRRLIRGLEPGTWLNDEIINYYSGMLQKRDNRLCRKSGSTRRSSHFFNVFFMSTLLKGGEYSYARVCRCYSKLLIHSKQV